ETPLRRRFRRWGRHRPSSFLPTRARCIPAPRRILAGRRPSSPGRTSPRLPRPASGPLPLRRGQSAAPSLPLYRVSLLRFSFPHPYHGEPNSAEPRTTLEEPGAARHNQTDLASWTRFSAAALVAGSTALSWAHTFRAARFALSSRGSRTGCLFTAYRIRPNAPRPALHSPRPARRH